MGDLSPCEGGYRIENVTRCFPHDENNLLSVMLEEGYYSLEDTPTPVNLRDYLKQVAPDYFVNEEGKIRVVFTTWEQLKPVELAGFNEFLQMING